MELQTPEKDLLGLLEENLRLREQLVSLEKDAVSWNRDKEMDDLESITALVRSLEEDISNTLSEFNTHPDGHDSPAFREDFHHAFQIMNDLFLDLKVVKEELEQSYLPSSELEQLKIDWTKLEKTFETMKQHVNPSNGDKELSFF